MNIPTNYGRPLMPVASALDDHDTIIRTIMREYGCWRGLQPSQLTIAVHSESAAAPFDPVWLTLSWMDAHDTEHSAEFTGWGTSLSSGLLESRLRFKIRAHGTALALRGLHSGAVAPSGPSSARAPDVFTARMNVL